MPLTGYPIGERPIDLLNAALMSAELAVDAIPQCPAAARRYLIHAANRMLMAAERLNVPAAAGADNVVSLRAVR